MRYRVVWPVLAAAVLTVLTVLTAACSAIGAGDRSSPVTVDTPVADSTAAVYYLSLGDSLARGLQPTSNGTTHATDQGYVDDVYAHYHAESKFRGSLTMVKLGCSGATTTSLLTGSGSGCRYRKGSQLAEALAFIRAHRARIALVTIDIGANDIVPCVTGRSISVPCAQSGLAEVGRDLPRILGALHKAVAVKTVVAGMTVYDPWLSYYLTGTQGKIVARQSLELIETLNALSAREYKAYGVRRADVQGAFATTDYKPVPAMANAGTEPLDVARICQWTWMCAAAPVGPNFHANAAGYRQIAGAFERIVGALRKPTR